jgi:hypothetical protein|tara:strand:- start:6090 stop:8825 length:2736 start_codon:yes stop_codon:yes gene_type:complete
MSSITALNIFQKNTDATATERGYEYQKLRTIEIWLQNKLNGKGVVVYYDYEEDIFERDLTNLKSKFRQLKLYSSNFSFASEEVTKTISHFFSLYCKGEYILDEVEFIFEANSNIARQYPGNDAILLKEWHQNQSELKGDLLEKCIEKCKAIVSDYIDSTKDDSPQVGKSKEVFTNVKESREFWEGFTKSIKWIFRNVEPEQSMSQSLNAINSLILKLPYLIDPSISDSIIHGLHFHISQCATKELPEDRLLTDSVLERIVLEAKGGDEKWYYEERDKWKDYDLSGKFVIGEIYEIIGLSRFYRQNPFLEGDEKQWKTILGNLLEDKGTADFCKKDILYELIFLKLRPTLEFKFKGNDDGSINEYAQNYFELVPDSQNDPVSIGDAVNLISILRAADGAELVILPDSSLHQWTNKIEAYISGIITSCLIEKRCKLLESLAFLQMNLKYWGQAERDEGFKEGLSTIREIINYSSEAKFYNYSSLYDIVNRIIDFFIDQDLAENYQEIIQEFEEVSSELAKLVEKREGKFSAAKVHRDRGIKYLHSSNPKNLLRALNHFQNAKLLLFQEETHEGFVLALLNVSQVYNALGLNMAAKYYALASFYIAIQDESLLKKATTSIGLIFHYDFNQGSWVSCIMDFERYITAKGEFDPDWDIEQNEDLRRTLIDYAFILHAAPVFSPQLTILIDGKMNDLGWLKDEFMAMFIKEFELHIKDSSKLHEVSKSKLVDFPLNDIGKERIIQWYSFGLLWKITFENDYESNILGEEFCAIFQVLLSELKITFDDLDFIDSIGTVKIILIKGSQLIPPKLINSDKGISSWEVSLPDITKPIPYYPNMLTILVHLMQELIKDKKVKLIDLFIELERDYELGSKTTVAQPYDILYKHMYSKKDYETLMRTGFEKVNIDQDFIKKSII